MAAGVYCSGLSPCSLEELKGHGASKLSGGSLSIVHRLLQGLMGTCGGFEFRLFFWALVRTLRRVW